MCEAYVGNGDCDSLVKHVETAIRARYVESHLSTLQLWDYITRAFQRKGEYTALIYTLQKTLDQFPDDLRTRTFLATALRNSGDYDKAMNVLQFGLRESSISDSYSPELVRIQLAKGNYEEAIETLRTWITDSGSTIYD